MKERWTIPDWFTLMRIIAVPIVAFLIIKNNFTAAFIVYVVAALTDFIDGFLARKLKQETEFGSRLDSFADWFLGIVSFAALWLAGAMYDFALYALLGICALGLIIKITATIKYKKFRYYLPHRNISRKTAVLVYAALGGIILNKEALFPYVNLILIVSIPLAIYSTADYFKYIFKQKN